MLLAILKAMLTAHCRLGKSIANHNFLSVVHV